MPVFATVQTAAPSATTSAAVFVISAAAVTHSAAGSLAEVARIFVLDEPRRCSFESLREYVDAEHPTLRHLWLRQPVLPIFDAIVNSPYIVDDPEDATVFFIASPLFLYDYNGTDGGARTPGGCVEEVRRHVEGFANGFFWKRRKGRDHFILYGSADFPSYWHGPPQGPWRPDLQRSPYRSFLQEAWPGLRRSMILTHGAVPDGKFFHAAHEEFSRYFFDVVRFVTVPPALPRVACGHHPTNRKYKVAFRSSSNDNMWEREHLLQFMDNIDDWKLPLDQVYVHVVSWSKKRSAWKKKHGLQDPSSKEQHEEEIIKEAANDAEFKREHIKNQSTGNWALWGHTDVCLDLPGDGGYTVRAYDALRHGCVPLFVTHKHYLFPKLPFAELIPWHKIAYFWNLEHSHRIFSCKRPVWRLAEHSCDQYGLLYSYKMLFRQLLSPSLKSAVAAKAREARKWLPAMLWEHHDSCELRPAAMDFLALELPRRLALMQKALDSGFSPVSSFELYSDLLLLKGACRQDVPGSCARHFRAGGDAMQRVHPDERDAAASTSHPCPFGFPFLHRTFASDFCGPFNPETVPKWLEDGNDEENYYGIVWACPIGCLPRRWIAPGHTYRLMLHDHFKLPPETHFGEAWDVEGVDETKGGPSVPVNGSFRICLQRGSAPGAKYQKWLPCRVPAAVDCSEKTAHSSRTGLRFCLAP